MSGRHAAPRRWQWPAWLLDLAWRLQATPHPRREDRATELWVDGLTVPDPEPPPGPARGVVHGPHPPARRPQVLTVARVRAAAIIRAIPLDAIPWLREGQYKDSIGTFTAISQEPPPLHADESVSLTRAALTAGLARHVEDWTP